MPHYIDFECSTLERKKEHCRLHQFYLKNDYLHLFILFYYSALLMIKNELRVTEMETIFPKKRKNWDKDIINFVNKISKHILNNTTLFFFLVSNYNTFFFNAGLINCSQNNQAEIQYDLVYACQLYIWKSRNIVLFHEPCTSYVWLSVLMISFTF